jgi:hypothetical protein
MKQNTVTLNCNSQSSRCHSVTPDRPDVTATFQLSRSAVTPESLFDHSDKSNRDTVTTTRRLPTREQRNDEATAIYHFEKRAVTEDENGEAK